MVHWIAGKVELSDLQKEGLEEIGNIGSGQSTDFLSDIIKRKVEIAIPEMGVIPLSESTKELKEKFYKKDPVFNVYVPITGLNGGISVILEKEDYIKLINLIEQQINEPYTLMELSEDIAKCYLEAVNNFLYKSLGFGDGKLFYMPIDSLLDYLSDNMITDEEKDSDALIINTEFHISDEISGKIVLLINIGHVSELTDALDRLLNI